MFFLILLLTSTILIYLYFKKKYSYWTKRGIKGPKAVPFFGTFLDEISLNGKEIEKKFFKQYGPVFGTYSGTQPVFNTSEPEHMKQVLNDPNTFQNFGLFLISDEFIQKSIFFLNASKWKSHRTAMTSHFTSRKLKNSLSDFEKITSNFLKNIEFLRQTSDEIDIKKMTKFYAVDMISKYVLAVDVDSFKQHQNDSEFAKQALHVGDINIVQVFLFNFIPTLIIKWLKMSIFDVKPINTLGKLFKQMVRERNSNLKYNDLAELLQDQIMANKVDMTEDEVVANCLLGFFAGADTTSNLLTKVFHFLIEHPEIKDKLYEEIKKDFSDEITYEKLTENKYLDAFINECLRLGISLLSLDKIAVKDTEIGDYKIEKGTIIYLILYLAHINEKYYKDPEVFNPDRFLDKSSSNENQINSGTFLPFSTGNRQCIGMRFALIELKYLIVRVLLDYDIYKPKNFKYEESSKRRFCVPLYLSVGFKKRDGN